MFERYTEMARRVIFSAKYEASQDGSNFIEAEHIVLGLLAEDKALGQRFFGSPNAFGAVRKKIEQVKPSGTKNPTVVDMPLSKDAKIALAAGANEADRLSSKTISTEHLLLGLLHGKTGLAAQILREYELELDSVRKHLIQQPHEPSLMGYYQGPIEALPPEIADAVRKLRNIVSEMEQAVAKRDFGKARAYSDEERVARTGLRALCEKHGLEGWRFR